MQASAAGNQAFVILKQLRDAAEDQTGIASRLSEIIKIISRDMGVDGALCFISI